MSYNQVKKEFEEKIFERAQGDEFMKHNPPELEIYQMGNGF